MPAYLATAHRNCHQTQADVVAGIQSAVGNRPRLIKQFTPGNVIAAHKAPAKHACFSARI